MFPHAYICHLEGVIMYMSSHLWCLCSKVSHKVPFSSESRLTKTIDVSSGNKKSVASPTCVCKMCMCGTCRVSKVWEATKWVSIGAEKSFFNRAVALRCMYQKLVCDVTCLSLILSCPWSWSGPDYNTCSVSKVKQDYLPHTNIPHGACSFSLEGTCFFFFGELFYFSSFYIHSVQDPDTGSLMVPSALFSAAPSSSPPSTSVDGSRSSQINWPIDPTILLFSPCRSALSLSLSFFPLRAKTLVEL